MKLAAVFASRSARSARSTVAALVAGCALFAAAPSFAAEYHHHHHVVCHKVHVHHHWEKRCK